MAFMTLSQVQSWANALNLRVVRRGAGGGLAARYRIFPDRGKDLGFDQGGHYCELNGLQQVVAWLRGFCCGHEKGFDHELIDLAEVNKFLGLVEED